MSIYVTIETHNAEIVGRELDLVGARGGDMHGIWPEIIRRMESYERMAFESQGLSSAERWEDLSYDWLRRKFQKGDNLNVLRASDLMYDSLTGETGDSVREMDTDYLAFGSSLPEFRYQQGWTIRSGFPRRKPVNFTPQQKRQFAELMLQWTMGTINRRGQFVNERGRFTGGGV